LPSSAERLHSLAIHILRRVRVEDGAAGLSAPRLSALSVIVYAGPITAGQLARAEQVRPPTVTRLVQALVRAGLVRRRRDRRDARVVRLEATAAGARLLATARRRRVRALAGELDQLSRRERRALREALDALERRFPREAPRSAPSAGRRRQ